MTYADGTQTRFGYDDNDRMISKTDALGGVQRTEYDRSGRLTRQIDAEGKVVVENFYDALGRLEKTQDGAGNEIRNEYPSALDDNAGDYNQPIAQHYPTFSQIQQYDNRGRVKHQTTTYHDGVKS